MKFEVLPNKKKRIAITLVAGGLITIVGIATFSLTRAKYQYTKSIPLIRANNISYSKSDLEIVAIKLKDGSTYTDTDTVPTSGYTLNETESICKDKSGNKIDTSFEYKEGKVIIGVSKKGSKCTIILDKASLKDLILAANGGEAAIKAKGNPDFSKTSCTPGTYNGTARTCGEDTTGMWAMEDDYGTSYYFRGTPTNNYVKFGKYASNYSNSSFTGKDMYWRIIRINGDGTIRLIYDGTEYHANGTSTSNIEPDGTSQIFNRLSDNNAYVGYTYATGIKRGTGSSSYAKTQLDKWYTSSGLSSYASYLSDSGFCGDRSTYNYDSPYSANDTLGIGTNKTRYGAYVRLYANKTPSLKCEKLDYGSKSDVYTVSTTKGNGQLQYPIGLISADEVSIAGGASKIANYAFYLHTKYEYITMSPHCFSSAAFVWHVGNDGCLSSDISNNIYLFRPVINLDPTKINNVILNSNGVYEVS